MIVLAGLLAATQAPPKADPEAYRLLEKAVSARASMPANFNAVQGEAVVEDDGKTYKFTFGYKAEGGAEVRSENAPEAVSKRLQGEVSSIYGHRRSRPFAEGDGRYPLAFTGEDGPLGRRIALNDSLKSSYRLRGDEITEVDRVMGGTRFVITMVENVRTPDGKVLPRHFTVNSFGADGSIGSSDVFTDEYEQVDGIWMIKSRRVITTKAGKISSWRATFSGLKVTLK